MKKGDEREVQISAAMISKDKEILRSVIIRIDLLLTLASQG
jgi:hypothetical protein